jgi:uncharacterized 2Fe-2S/4Fe-4S cluster protein (DUF4445 family)
VRLSCQAKIRGDVLINVPEESRGNKQIVRKSASNRAIEVKPSVRKYLVSMTPPTLERPIADWERLAKGLETSMALVRGTEEKLPRWYEFEIDYLPADAGENPARSEMECDRHCREDKEVIEVQAGYHEDSYGAAVDIGSTTVALYLCNLRTGEVLASESEMNPQIVYGEDVMSRIQYAIDQPDGLEKLHKAIISTLNKLLKQAAKTAKIWFENRGNFGNGLGGEFHHAPCLLNLTPEGSGTGSVRADDSQIHGYQGAGVGIAHQPIWQYSHPPHHCFLRRRGYQRDDRGRRTAQAG